MEQAKFKNCVREIYAAHGKTPPTDAVMLAVWKRVEDMPDAFMPWAAVKLSDYERLPANLGLELAKQLYPEWRAETRKTGPSSSNCPECDPRIPGYFFGWKRDSQGILRSGICRCLCNADPAMGNMPRMSRALADSQGIAVMPVGCPGGPAAFEQARFEPAAKEAACPPGPGLHKENSGQHTTALSLLPDGR